MSDFNSLVQYTVENISRPVKYIIYKLTEFIRVVDKFVFRQVPAGAASGYATIEKIEGNTVKFNQLVSESRLVSSGTQNGLTIQRDGFHLSITGTPLSTSTYISIFTYPYIPVISGHKFYVHIPPTNSSDIYFWFSGGEWLFFSRIVTIGANNITASLRVRRTDINVNINGYIQIIDLTAIFGAGNEPSTVADFEAWLAQNIGSASYYDYNAGELISCKMSGMQTEDSSQQTLDTLHFDVTTFTGINTATNVREVIFPNGMKQADYAGTVKDTLDLLSDTATVNVGSRAYQSGDESDTTVITDGTNTYYALTTPIEYTDLQDANGNPLNPRYKVEQGGTEQVLPVNTSTPTTVAPTLTTTYTKDNN